MIRFHLSDLGPLPEDPPPADLRCPYCGTAIAGGDACFSCLLPSAVEAREQAERRAEFERDQALVDRMEADGDDRP